jgi:hypothetical protein
MAAEALKDPNVRAAYDAMVRDQRNVASGADPNGSEPGAKSGDEREKEAAHRRLMWFYERSPYFDREVGVYPVFRVKSDLGVPTAAWSPPGVR